MFLKRSVESVLKAFSRIQAKVGALEGALRQRFAGWESRDSDLILIEIICFMFGKICRLKGFWCGIFFIAVLVKIVWIVCV